MHLVESSSSESGSIVAFAKGFGCLHAWVAGADPQLRESGATSLLYWKFLEQAGGLRFDFVGANMPGIALFKRGFGGELIPYFATQRANSRLLKAGVTARNLLRH